jgi:hypothetical protein
MNCSDCLYSDIAEWKLDEKTEKVNPIYWCERYRKLCTEIQECLMKAESEEE